MEVRRLEVHPQRLLVTPTALLGEARPPRLLASPAARLGRELPQEHHHLWHTYHRLAVPFPWEVYRNLLREGQFHDLRDGKWRYQHGPKRPLSRRSASPLRRVRAPAGHLKASLW